MFQCHELSMKVHMLRVMRKIKMKDNHKKDMVGKNPFNIIDVYRRHSRGHSVNKSEYSALLRQSSIFGHPL